MCQNLLPFEWSEMRRYGLTLIGFKMALLRGVQSRTFRQADGVIHLTRYARDAVVRVISDIHGKTAIIPHGIERRFFAPPRNQFAIDQYSIDRPFRILYVSIVDVYKHQWHVAEAVAQLRHSGLPVVLDIVGPAYRPALARLKRTLDRVDPAGKFVRYLGAEPNDSLHARYAVADLFVFASSCETISSILLEGMASGLPIACSRRGPMPEVLGDAGVYFDPEKPDDIARALRKLIEVPELRARSARAARERAESYSWHSCARETFAFLGEVSRAHGRKSELPAVS
jgi:glycosyltransferase involved in cell wall biosynthesis